jgi:TrmH family RNA methyltransferase
MLGVRYSFNHAVTTLLKEVRRAANRGSLTSDGLAVAEGFHLLEEALRSRCEIRAVIVAEPVRATVEAHVRGLKNTRVIAVSEAAFAELSSTDSPQGVISLVKPPAWTMAQLVRGKPLVIVLDGVQDPGNAGAVVRAGEAFGATGVAFLKGSVNPHNPKCLRASAGSIFRLPVVTAIEESLLLAALEQKRVTLFAAVPRDGKLLSETDLTGSCAIVIGSEARGISPKLARKATGIRIPTIGVESLNAAVAAGVMLYEASRQRTL